jgi:hypothetical protein
MIPEKVKEHLDEYINQEIYVQIAIIKGKEKGTTKSAISKYLSSNHFKDLSKGKPYDHFIEGLKEKCLIKLSNSPMRNKETDDQVIKELQKKLNELSDEKLKDTYWEIETGEYLSGDQVNELEIERDKIIKKLSFENKENKKDEIYETIISFCKKYEELCVKNYPEAPLPLEVLKSLN